MSDPSAVDQVTHAIKRGDTIAVRRYIESGANMAARDSHGKSPLMVAADRGNSVLIGMLLDAGADPNERWPGGWTPLARAAVAGSASAVARLLEAGATPALSGLGVTHVRELVQEDWPERTRILALLAEVDQPDDK
jgi:uncharacterized protein